MSVSADMVPMLPELQVRSVSIGGAMDAVTSFLLEDGQVVSELPEGRDAAKHVKIRVESHDHGITVEVFVPWGSGIYRSSP
jgi:hypothetical protein